MFWVFYINNLRPDLAKSFRSPKIIEDYNVYLHDADFLSGFQTGCVSFIGIDMHFQGKLFIDPDQYLTHRHCPFAAAFDIDVVESRE